MKKLFALLLAVVMVLGMAACAPADGGETTTNAPAVTTTAPAATTTAPAATTTEGVDMSATPFVEPGSVKLTIGIPVNATVLDYHENYLTKTFEEISGLDLDFVFFSSDGTEALQQLTLMVANKEKLPDVLINVIKNQTTAAEFAQSGAIIDLTPYWEGGYAYNADQYINLMPENEKNDFWAKMANPITGEMYFYPQYQHQNNADNMVYLGGFNTIMAENVGMKAEEIDTVAEVYEFLTKTVNEDGNGNGKKDEMGLVTPMNCGYRPDVFQWVINAYVYCNDNYKWNVTDGELWSPYSTDEYRMALIELHKWYKEGLISPLCYSIQNLNEMITLMDADVDTVCLFGDTPTVITNPETKLGEKSEGLNVLKAETDKGGYATRRNPFSMATRCVVTSSAERPDLAFRFLDLMSTDEMYHISRFGEEGYGWEHIDGEAEGLKTATGEWASRRTLQDEWSKESTQTWKNNVWGFLWTAEGYEAGLCCAGAASNTGDKGARAYASTGTFKNMVAGEWPEEFIYDLVYNADETAVNDEYLSLYGSYVSEARAKFITGVLDPNDDAAWDTYLKELAANGESELLEAAQSAYDRMVG